MVIKGLNVVCFIVGNRQFIFFCNGISRRIGFAVNSGIHSTIFSKLVGIIRGEIGGSYIISTIGMFIVNHVVYSPVPIICSDAVLVLSFSFLHAVKLIEKKARIAKAVRIFFIQIVLVKMFYLIDCLRKYDFARYDANNFEKYFLLNPSE